MSMLLLGYSSLTGETRTVRTLQRDNDVLFSLDDVVALLASENTSVAAEHGARGLGGMLKATLRALDPDESVRVPDQSSRGPMAPAEVYVTEPGLYRIVSSDDSPACKRFQRWIFHEVLPSIRKYGTYPPPSAGKQSNIKALAAQLLQSTNLLIQEIEEREKLARETNARFETTQRQLDELYDRLDHTPEESTELQEIKAHCADLELSSNEILLLWAWCSKRSIEGNRLIKRQIKNGEEIHLFEPDVIARVVSELGLRKSK